MSEEPSQPLGPAEIFSRGCRLWWRNLRPMATVTLAVSIPLQVLSYLILFISFPGYFKMLEAYPEMFNSLGQASNEPNAALETARQYDQMMLQFQPGSSGLALVAIGEVLILLIAVVMIALVAGSVMRIALGDLVGAPVSWRDGLSAAIDRVRSMSAALAITWILLIAAVVVTFFLLGLPALWLAVAWILILPVILFEGLPVFEAIGRSFRLVRGRWWPVFGTLIVLNIVLFVAMIPLVAPYAVGLFLGWPLPFTLGLAVVGGLILVIITYPMTATVIGSIYLDLRLRREGVAPKAGAGGALEWEQVAEPVDPFPPPPTGPVADWSSQS